MALQLIWFQFNVPNNYILLYCLRHFFASNFLLEIKAQRLLQSNKPKCSFTFQLSYLDTPFYSLGPLLGAAHTTSKCHRCVEKCAALTSPFCNFASGRGRGGHGSGCRFCGNTDSIIISQVNDISLWFFFLCLRGFGTGTVACIRFIFLLLFSVFIIPIASWCG